MNYKKELEEKFYNECKNNEYCYVLNYSIENFIIFLEKNKLINKKEIIRFLDNERKDTTNIRDLYFLHSLSD